jgi:hypothetical protein
LSGKNKECVQYGFPISGLTCTINSLSSSSPLGKRSFTLWKNIFLSIPTENKNALDRRGGVGMPINQGKLKTPKTRPDQGHLFENLL